MAKKDPLFISERDRLMAVSGITLNGKPAYIAGRLRPFALVWQAGEDLAECQMAEFSWEAVQRIVDSTKQFFT